MKIKYKMLALMALIAAPNGFAVNQKEMRDFLEQAENSPMTLEGIQDSVLSMLLDADQDEKTESLINRILSSGTKQGVIDTLKDHVGLNQPVALDTQVDKEYLETVLHSLVDGAFDDEDDLPGFKGMLQTVLDEVPLNQLKIEKALTKQAALDTIAKEYGFSRIELPKKILPVLQQDISHLKGGKNTNSVTLSNTQKQLLHGLLLELTKSRPGEEESFKDKKEFLKEVISGLDENAPDIEEFERPNKWDLVEKVVHHYKLPRIQRGG